MPRFEVTFGEWSRYKIKAMHTRFDTIEYFVTDADQTDEITGGPKVIRQSDTLEEALNVPIFAEEDKQYVRDRIGIPVWEG
jgi:hypothetical protein